MSFLVSGGFQNPLPGYQDRALIPASHPASQTADRVVDSVEIFRGFCVEHEVACETTEALGSVAMDILAYGLHRAAEWAADPETQRNFEEGLSSQFEDYAQEEDFPDWEV